MRMLTVDDDPLILRALNRTFHTQRPEWEVVSVDSGEEAVRQMAGSRFDIVLTDMQMPGMDGSQVLHHARQLPPGAVRVVLSGHAPLRRILEAEGDYHRFLVKPVDPNDLVVILDSFCLDPAAEDARMARSFVAGLERIPSLSRHLVALKEQLEQPTPNLQRLAAIIGQDIGMASKVLKLVNSAYMPFRRSITSLSQAVEFLGVDLLQEMVLSRDLLAAAVDERPEGLSLEDVWAHSVRVGRLARELVYKETGDRRAAEETYSVGLLHDIGLVAMAIHPGCPYHSVLEKGLAQGEILTQLERQTFGTDHIQVGAQLVSLWGLPAPFASAIQRQYLTSLDDHPTLISLALHAAHSWLDQQVLPGDFTEGTGMSDYPEADLACADSRWNVHVKKWKEGRPPRLPSSDNADPRSTP
jgi:HD-like signal output (HDOD) protein